MAFITFLGHKKAVGVYRLGGPTTVGRSLDCDVYVPDVYLSRHHCLFEQHNGLWRVVDLESSNGIWSDGQRLRTAALKPGDVIEIGTIAVMFNEGDPEKTSNPAPFGMGFGAAELMDTICTEGLRPADYSKRQSTRKTEFARRMREKVTRMEEEAELPVAAAVATSPGEEWTELDIEFQITAAQELFMYEWEPPIFNPPRRSARSAPATDPRPSAVPVRVSPAQAYAPAGVDLGSAAQPTGVATDDYDLHPAAGAPVKRPPVRYQAPALPVEQDYPPAKPRRSVLAAATSWLPLGRKSAPPVTNMEGCVFHRATRWDHIKDNAGEWLTTCKGYAKLNPAIAGAVVLAVVVVIGIAIRFTPVGKSGPHIYVPPQSDVAVAKKTVVASD